MKSILLLLCTGLATFGQKATITDISNGQSTFPKITLADQKNTKTINRNLRREVLGLEKPVPDQQLLDKATHADGYSIDYLGYEVLYNNRVLCLEVSYEGCAAYCEANTQRLVFDLKTARTLKLTDLLLPAATDSLCQRINATRRERILQQVARLKAVGQDSITGDRLEETLTLYDSCLEREYTRDDLPDVQFTWLGQKLKIYTNACSSHFNKELDALDEFVLKLDLNQCNDWLTAYAKTLVKP